MQQKFVQNSIYKSIWKLVQKKRKEILFPSFSACWPSPPRTSPFLLLGRGPSGWTLLSSLLPLTRGAYASASSPTSPTASLDSNRSTPALPTIPLFSPPAPWTFLKELRVPEQLPLPIFALSPCLCSCSMRRESPLVSAAILRSSSGRIEPYPPPIFAVVSVSPSPLSLSRLYSTGWIRCNLTNRVTQPCHKHFLAN